MAGKFSGWARLLRWFEGLPVAAWAIPGQTFVAWRSVISAHGVWDERRLESYTGPRKSDSCCWCQKTGMFSMKDTLPFGVRSLQTNCWSKWGKGYSKWGDKERREKGEDRDKCTLNLGSQGPLSWLTIVRACFLFFVFCFSGSTC